MKFIVILSVLAATALAQPTRIIGGVDAKIGEFPYQVSIQLTKYWVITQHVCGGSIIAPQWIVTAGHCIIDPGFLGSLSVKAGLLNLSDDVEAIKIEKTIVHPGFSGGVGPNDIALIKLEKRLQYNDLIKPINLPSKDQEYDLNVVLSGWGVTTNGPISLPAPKLQTVTLPLLTNEECRNALEKVSGTSEPLEESNICTGPLEGGHSACSGDSGGPLAQNNVLVGIVSWGMMPCASEGAPAVFTDVRYFLDFIKSNTVSS